MLGACRRVMRSGGRMAFAVISLAPGLGGAARREAAAAAPTHTEAPAPYTALLRQAGFEVLVLDDVTAEFERITRADLAAYLARAEQVVQAMGEADYAARLALRRRRAAALADGLLRREILVARPAAGKR